MRRELVSDEKVPIAVHEVHRHAPTAHLLQRGGDLRVQRLPEIVVARPILEEISKDIQRVGTGHPIPQEAKEEVVGLRPFAAEMQVGDE